MRLLALILLFWLPPNGPASPDMLAYDACTMALQQDDWRCEQEQPAVPAKDEAE